MGGGGVTDVAGSLYTFPLDFADAGVDRVLDDVVHRSGINEVKIAANYHAARDIFPHNPRRVSYSFVGGAVHFAIDPDRYDGLPLQPFPDPGIGPGNDIAKLAEQARRRSVEVHAWLNYCHQDITPYVAGTVVENAFGEPDEGQLCPSNPFVRDYLTALTADVAAASPESIIAEAIHFGQARHGYHHERWFTAMSPATVLLLGLCFCRHCRNAAESAGIDAAEVADIVRRGIRRGLESAAVDVGDEGLSRDTLLTDYGAELDRFLQVRINTVSSLATRLASTARLGGSRLVCMDPAGAVRGYMPGEVSGTVGPLPAWQLGFDLAALAQTTGEVAILGYVREPAVLRDVIDSYRRVLPATTRLAVVLRPALPDCADSAALAAKVRVCIEADVDRIDFYHYAFTPTANLSWIRDAL